MQARRCQGCAAPLPESATSEPIRCPFCGLLHDAAAPVTPRVQVLQATTEPAPGVPRWVLAVVALIVITTAVPIIVAGFVAWRAGSLAIDLATSVAEPATGSTGATGVRTTAQLKDLPSGFHPLQVAPPAGGYGAVDPIAALPWALAIAQAWRDDARLERIDVVRVRPDGTVNVADDEAASLAYRFVSASAVSAQRDQARLGSSTEAVVGMWVQVTKGAPEVYGSTARVDPEDSRLPHPDAEPLTRLMSRPAVRTVQGGLPFLKGYLIHLRDEGWVWYLSSLASESKPRIRARDGAVWPYRTSRS